MTAPSTTEIARQLAWFQTGRLHFSASVAYYAIFSDNDKEVGVIAAALLSNRAVFM